VLAEGKDGEERQMLADELYAGGRGEASSHDWALDQLRRDMAARGMDMEGGHGADPAG